MYRFKIKIPKLNLIPVFCGNLINTILALLFQVFIVLCIDFRAHMEVMGKLAQIYNSEICFTKNDTDVLHKVSSDNELSKIIYPGQCMYGEPDLERLIKRTDLNPDQLEWIWKIWYNFVGPKIKDYYPFAVQVQNIASRKNGNLFYFL